MVRILCILLATSMPLSMGLKIQSSSKTRFDGTDFKDFVQFFGRKYRPGMAEWNHREKIFNANKALVAKHQATENRTWEIHLNKFSDWTPDEKKKIMGFKPSDHAKPSWVDLFKKKDTSDHSMHLNLMKELPESVDWSKHPKLKHSGQFIRDQGMCGSCWAVSTASLLESHVELHQKDKLVELGRYQGIKSLALSSQSLVSCVENPHHCGGTGGCDGATIPLAFDLIKEKGMPWGADYPYASYYGSTGTCDNSALAASTVKIEDYVIPPKNELMPLLQALYQQGPVGVSVAAEQWMSYDSGILQFDANDWDVNHAVVAYGFGQDGDNKYWLIKNSWGKDWGEKGFIRLQRFDREDNVCGMDTTPEHGDACDGETKPVRVCGSFGILYATSYPIGVTIE